MAYALTYALAYALTYALTYALSKFSEIKVFGGRRFSEAEVGLKRPK